MPETKVLRVLENLLYMYVASTCTSLPFSLDLDLSLSLCRFALLCSGAWRTGSSRSPLGFALSLSLSLSAWVAGV